MNVQILNFYGNEVLSINVDPHQAIDVSHLKKGIYILSIDKEHFQKIIINK